MNYRHILVLLSESSPSLESRSFGQGNNSVGVAVDKDCGELVEVRTRAPLLLG